MELTQCREYTANTQMDCVITQLACAAMHKKDSGKNLIGLYVGHRRCINWPIP